MADEIEDDKKAEPAKDDSEKGEAPKRKKFSTGRKTEDVEMEDDDGKTETYTVREMSGTGKGEWQNHVNGLVKTDPNGNPIGMKNFIGMEAKLISKCLIGPDGKYVKDTVIREWSSSVQTELFKLCQQINGLDDNGPDREKNS